MTAAARQRRAQTDRTRRYRQRQRSGVEILQVPVLGHELAEALILAGRLSVAEALSRAEMQRAVSELLGDIAKDWKRYANFV